MKFNFLIEQKLLLLSLVNKYGAVRAARFPSPYFLLVIERKSEFNFFDEMFTAQILINQCAQIFIYSASEVK